MVEEGSYLGRTPIESPSTFGELQTVATHDYSDPIEAQIAKDTPKNVHGFVSFGDAVDREGIRQRISNREDAEKILDEVDRHQTARFDPYNGGNNTKITSNTDSQNWVKAGSKNTSVDSDAPSAGSTQSTTASKTQTTQEGAVPQERQTETIPEERSLVPIQEEASTGDAGSDGPHDGSTSSSETSSTTTAGDIPKRKTMHDLKKSQRIAAYRQLSEVSGQERRDLYDHLMTHPEDIKRNFGDYVRGNPHTLATIAGGATMGAVVLGLSDSRGQLTNQQLYGQDDLT